MTIALSSHEQVLLEHLHVALGRRDREAPLDTRVTEHRRRTHPLLYEPGGPWQPGTRRPGPQADGRCPTEAGSSRARRLIAGGPGYSITSSDTHTQPSGQASIPTAITIALRNCEVPGVGAAWRGRLDPLAG